MRTSSPITGVYETNISNMCVFEEICTNKSGQWRLVIMVPVMKMNIISTHCYSVEAGSQFIC